MNGSSASTGRTTYQVLDASTSERCRPDLTSPWRPGDLELDLVDVMLDLDPGALIWSPRGTSLRASR